MKGRCSLLFVSLFTVATAFGDYELSWYTIDGDGFVDGGWRVRGGLF